MRSAADIEKRLLSLNSKRLNGFSVNVFNDLNFVASARIFKPVSSLSIYRLCFKIMALAPCPLATPLLICCKIRQCHSVSSDTSRLRGYSNMTRNLSCSTCFCHAALFASPAIAVSCSQIAPCYWLCCWLCYLLCCFFRYLFGLVSPIFSLVSISAGRAGRQCGTAGSLGSAASSAERMEPLKRRPASWAACCLHHPNSSYHL